MLSGMYSAATAVNAMERRQEVVSQNLSHVNTPGYRGQSLSFATLLPQKASNGVNAALGNGTRVNQSKTDFTAGHLIRTERELDVAIDGEGFFELKSATARAPFYTRAGVFFIGQEGTLVAANGMTLQGENGPIQIPTTVTPNQIRVTQEGSLLADGQNVGQIKIVQFADNSRLQRRGETMFTAPANLPTQESSARLIQGMREGANVNAADQLVHMIASMRHHEAALRALRSMSDTLQQHTRGN